MPAVILDQQLELPIIEKNNRTKPVIDVRKIQSELQELAGDVRVIVKLDKHQWATTKIYERDHFSKSGEYSHNSITITFNPRRFRSPKKFEEHLNWCREAVTL